MTDDPEGPKTLFLEPACANESPEGRMWCEDDVWGQCDDCAMPSVKYLRADHALALVATDREACAAYCESHTMEIPMNRKKKVFAGLFCEGEAAGGGIHAGMGYADAIRSRTPSDAFAALEARDKRVRDEALREAAEAVEGARCNPWATDAILALIKGDQTDE